MQQTSLGSIPALFLDLCAAKDFPGWAFRKGGTWQEYSPKRLRDDLFFATLALFRRGVGEESSLGIAANTSPDWILADLACESCHAPTVPLFPNISEEHFLFQCKDSKVEFLAVDSVESLSADIARHISEFRLVICFDDAAKLPANGIFWKDLLDEGRNFAKEEGAEDWFKYQVRTISPTDLFSVIYTSGSTGLPKGAELSHASMISEVAAIAPLLDMDPAKDVAMSVLPVAHVFERMVICVYMAKHVKIYFADSPKNTGVIAHEVRPTIATCVPRILEKLADSVAAREFKLTGFRKILMHRAVLFAKKALPDKAKIRRKIYDRLIYRQVREAMGGRFRWIISGSSALNKTVYRFLTNMGFPIYEGYGLTECCPVVSVNLPGNFKMGSVGKPLKTLQVKIGENNEILVKGKSVFHGYRNMPDMNRAAWTPDGFFRTGDQGFLDRDGFLFLLGRLKEIFKTSTGKYVSPLPIELELVRYPLIEAAQVVANNRKFVSALLFLGRDEAARMLGLGKKHFDAAAAAKDPRVLAAIGQYIELVNHKLNSWERIKKWTLIADDLSIESGLMTPTFKLRRKAVEKRYSAEIEKIYSDG